MPMPPRWSVEQHVRADADRVFVPSEDLDGATIGDRVQVVSPDEAPTRTGTIIEVVDDERGMFFVVDLG